MWILKAEVDRRTNIPHQSPTQASEHCHAHHSWSVAVHQSVPQQEQTLSPVAETPLQTTFLEKAGSLRLQKTEAISGAS